MQQESFPPRIVACSNGDDRRGIAAGTSLLVACKRPRDVRPAASYSPSPPAKSSFPRIPLLDITNGYSTPSRVPSDSSPGRRDAFVSPPADSDILDEDFLDDDFFREVDVICQEMSTARKEERPRGENSGWWSSTGGEEAGTGLMGLSGEPVSGIGRAVDGGEETGLLELSAEPTSGIWSAMDGGEETGFLELSGEPTSGFGSVVNGGSEESVSGLVELREEPTSWIASPVHCTEELGPGRPSPSWGKDGVDGSVPLKYREYLQSLNDAQREAACSDISIPLMVVAGPGSGKTSTMVGRVLTLLKEGIGPSNILAMTFTTAAASEMRDRIGTVVGKTIAKELSISTFHSFCLQLCRTHAEKLGRTPEFVIYGHGQQRRAVIEALRLVSNSKKCSAGNRSQKFGELHGSDITNSLKEKSKKWQKFVTQAKASGRSPAECEIIGDDVEASILRCYDEILRSCNALDYHDFISSSVKLLTDFPDVYMECLDKWKAIVVDEFQDTSSMQYHLLRILASHKRVTIVGDEDQSIFSFNGANACGFDSFRKDFSPHKEVRLKKNYRSTRCIVEAASALIHNNKKRCPKQLETDNTLGCQITVKECQNEDAQCAFVVDKILELRSSGSADYSFGNVAILYRRQVSGKAFQMSFRNRKIPFNVHGVAFYRKKIIKAVMALLRTTLPDCDDGPFRLAFKALFPGGKEEKKMVVEYVEKICTTRNCSFALASNEIFHAKISGTLKRAQLTQGRKILSTLDMLSKLVKRESSISMVISSAVNMLPQKYLLKQRAVVDVEGGKLLNEDDDLRSVIQYLMDDVSDFLSTHFTKEDDQNKNEGKGCMSILKAFIDFITLRETENFRSRRLENENSVTLTTIHQSKGLEWDTVFIVKANDNEIPLLHEYNGIVGEGGTTIDEERRLLYVAITRARKKLFILYVMMDSNWQLLQSSRFLKEIPAHLLDIQGSTVLREASTTPIKDDTPGALRSEPFTMKVFNQIGEDDDLSRGPGEVTETCTSNSFLKRFSIEERSMISHLFHQWAKKKSFQQPNRLLDKVGFVIDERLRNKTSKHKDGLRILKSCLKDDEAIQYADSIIKWEQIPIEQRAHLTREKQEHFQKQRIEMSMGSSEATVKQIAYLQKLGCTISPTSRLHASRLIEQYKSL